MELSLGYLLVPGIAAVAGTLLIQRLRRTLLSGAAAAAEPVRRGDPLPDLDRLVLAGHGGATVLQSACDSLVTTLDLTAVWAAEARDDGGMPMPSAVSGDWRGRTLPGAELAATALKQAGSAVDPAGGLAATALTAAGEPVGVVVAAVGRGAQASAAVYGLERLAPRLGAALRLAGDQHRLRLLGGAIEAAANAILITDAEGRVEWANEAFSRLSGWRLDEIRGQTLRLLRSGVQRRAAGDVWRGEVVERRKDGSFYTVEQTITPMPGLDGGISHFVVVHEDITARKRAEEHIRYLSNYDTLTALPNRALFRERLGQAIDEAKELGERLAVLFVDLEHFTRINDAMGHDVGDRLLTVIVERLTMVAPQAHTIARVGGDEFAIVAAGVGSEAEAARLARMISGAVTAAMDVEGHEIHVGASIGIAMYPQDGEDADQLMKNADVAMYRAIHEAPNGHRFFSSELSDEVKSRLGLERDLRRALGQRQFVLHYQPQLDAVTGRVVALEALLRWQHPEHGLVAPAIFIPIAEQTGQILPIGEWVIQEACAQIRRWKAEGVPVVPVAVNLSAPQLRQPALAERVREILAEEGVEAGLIELELTESMVMADGAVSESALHRLDDGGIRIAIDDFGTGYSSLAYLKRFPVQKLKIDRSFVSDLERDANDAQIARAIISLGHSLGLKVVSEGVETQEQLDYLRREGCDAVQGFLFSKAVPPDEAATLLRERRFERAPSTF